MFKSLLVTLSTLSIFFNISYLFAQEAKTPVNEEVMDIADVDLSDLLGEVVSATKTIQSIEEAPSMVDVITGRDIKRRGYRTVGEALKSVQGISIIDDHLYTNVGIRGLYSGAEAFSDIVKLMINGQPVSFRANSGNFFGQELIPIEAVKRIEVIKGPGSALYGANAFLGVINVITYNGADYTGDRPTHKIALDGFYRQNEANTSFNGGGTLLSGWKKDDFEYFLAGNYYYSDRSGLHIPGLSDMVDEHYYRQNPILNPPALGYPSPGWGQTQRRIMFANTPSLNDLSRVASGYAVASYDLDFMKIFIDGNVQYFDKFGEFQGFSYLTHQNRLTYLNWYSRLRFERKQEQGFSFMGSVAVAGGKPTDDEHISDPLVPGGYRQRDFGYFSIDGQLELSYAFNKNFNLTLGFDVNHDVQNLLTVNVFSEITGDQTSKDGFGEENFENYGAYLQALWKPVENLGITAGSRIDRNSVIACSSDTWSCIGKLEDQLVEGTGGDDDILVDDRGMFQISNRLAMVYNLKFAGLYTKLMYGSSFKPPSPYQLYHNPITLVSSRGVSYLKPQTADTIELLVGSRPSKNIHVSINGYFTKVNDMVMIFQEDGTTKYRGADATLIGVEGQLNYLANDYIYFFANVSYAIEKTLHPQQDRSENDMTWEFSEYNIAMPAEMYPTLRANAGININLPQYYLNTNLNMSFVGKRGASPINNQLYNPLDLLETYYFDPYMIVDVTISSSGLKLFNDKETYLSVSVRGAPGDYAEPGYMGVDIPSLGTRIYFKVEQQF